MSATVPEMPPLPTVPDTTPAPVGQFGPASDIDLAPAPAAPQTPAGTASPEVPHA